MEEIIGIYIQLLFVGCTYSECFECYFIFSVFLLDFFNMLFSKNFEIIIAIEWFSNHAFSFFIVKKVQWQVFLCWPIDQSLLKFSLIKVNLKCNKWSILLTLNIILYNPRVKKFIFIISKYHYCWISWRIKR